MSMFYSKHCENLINNNEISETLMKNNEINDNLMKNYEN